MAESKYDYLKTTGIVRSSIYPPFLGMIFFALKNSSFQIRFTHVSSPFEMKEAPHQHDFAEVFVFVPCTEDLNAFDAESEIQVGDGDKITISQTTAVHIPAGLMHCPIVHKRVGTPFFFVNCPITPAYSAIVESKKVDVPVDAKIFNREEWQKSGQSH
jgi:hypothetical protein